jgi:hypothetical protein
LRRQYLRRDPEANPIGQDPSFTFADRSAAQKARSAESVAEPETSHDNAEGDNSSTSPNRSTSALPVIDESIADENDLATVAQASDEQTLAADQSENLKNWNNLPMLVKLDSMYLLTEWQFQNAQRLRTLMKDDDETATWVSWFDLLANP